MAYLTNEKATGPATVLAIGKATPPNEFLQSEYPDYYFNVTNSSHKHDLKAKFERICKKTDITKRHFYCTEEILKANPVMLTYDDASLNVRQKMAIREVPRLGAQAAEEALKAWGQPKEKITHVVFATTGSIAMPGPDVTLTRLLGLNYSVNRTMLYNQGCFAGCTVMRFAKDLVENNKGARVLAVVSELTCVTFRGPSETHLDNLVGSALFGDGASALIIGADPLPVERPLYEFLWSGETILDESDGAIEGGLTEAGLVLHLVREVPGIICKESLPILKVARSFMPGEPSWNDMFWCVHPGGRAILDALDGELGLKPEKLQYTRDMLRDYGNMSGASVHFILDHMRNQSLKKNASTTGDGFQYGLMVAFGPGLTIEVSVLKSMPLTEVPEKKADTQVANGVNGHAH